MLKPFRLLGCLALAASAPAAYGHNAICDCFDNGDDTITCEGGFSDGAKAVVVEVEDTGLGIDATSLDKLFDAFVTTKRGGMGLGLAICRMIIERHGGQLSASPARPRGAVFRIVLPQASVPH